MTKDKSDTKQLTIDGKQLDFTPGQTVLQVALENDIYIPHLCYIEGLKSYGGCRLCVVKIVGDRKPYQTSCSTPAKAGMEIITKDEELQEMRRNVIQMIISEHPNNCLVCEHSEKCNDLETLHAEKPSKRVFGCFSCPSKEYCELR